MAPSAGSYQAEAPESAQHEVWAELPPWDVPGEAAASYLKVLELDPEADTAQTALERIFSAQSDWAGLISAYERRAELVRDDAKRVEILRRAARVPKPVSSTSNSIMGGHRSLGQR